MPKIPVLAPPYRNVDEVAVLEGGTELIDGYFDESGALNRRWGLWSWWSAQMLPGVDGLYWWKDKQVLLVAAGGRVFAFNNLTSAPTEITTESVRLLINRKVHFDSTKDMCFMVNGHRILQWNGSGEATLIDSDLAPARCNSLALFAQRLLAVEEGTQTVYLTEAIEDGNVSVVWKPTWLSPNSNSDNVTRIAAGWSELTLFGTYSTEIWYFTGQEETETDIPFARLEGAAIEKGLAAPNAVVSAFNTYWWLDGEHRVVRLEGRSPKVISIPIDKHLRAIRDVSDCRAFVIDRWIVWSFPKAAQTWVYDTLSESWTRWGKWNQEIGQYEAYLGQGSVYVPEWGTTFVAGRKEGRVFITHPNLVTDVSEPIRLVYRSAHFDHGTMARKVSNRLMIRLKRGS